MATIRIYVGSVLPEIDPEEREELKLALSELCAAAIEAGEEESSIRVSSLEDGDRQWLEFQAPPPSLRESILDAPHRGQLLRALIPDAAYLAAEGGDLLVRIPVGNRP